MPYVYVLICSLMTVLGGWRYYLPCSEEENKAQRY